MYLGSVGYLISLFVVAWAFNIGQGVIVVFSVFMFIASHAVGQGAIAGLWHTWDICRAHHVVYAIFP